jgi:hypothetical protein
MSPTFAVGTVIARLAIGWPLPRETPLGVRGRQALIKGSGP